MNVLRVLEPDQFACISVVRHASVFWQTTRIGVNPTLTAREPSWEWLRSKYFSTSSPWAMTSGSRFRLRQNPDA